MSSRFNQGKPARTTPPVCFPPPGGILPVPTLLPKTLHAACYCLYLNAAGTQHLDILRKTLIRDNGDAYWHAESGDPPDYYRMIFQYNQAGDFVTFEYERGTEIVPDHTTLWELPRKQTAFPTFVAFPKDIVDDPPTTTWAYVTA